jgi:hypothetical protein
MGTKLLCGICVVWCTLATAQDLPLLFELGGWEHWNREPA